MNFLFKNCNARLFFRHKKEKLIWNENFQRKFCEENSNLPFGVPGNVKLKLPNNLQMRKNWYVGEYF
jgi:hypothetical protein